IRGIAIDAAGEIFTATWGGYIAKYDRNGNFVASLHPGGSQMDIALDTDGQIATGDRSGMVYLTDTSLSPIKSFATGQWNAFVTFSHFINVATSTDPVADAGGPYSVSEGGSVQLDGSKSSHTNPNPQPLTYLWDLDGDGVFGETGGSATRGSE